MTAVPQFPHEDFIVEDCSPQDNNTNLSLAKKNLAFVEKNIEVSTEP